MEDIKDYKKAIENIRLNLRDYILENKIKSLIIGISGGIDSCLCAALAKPVCDAHGVQLIGRSLPILTNSADELQRAKLTGKAFCSNFKEDKILEVYYERMSSELGYFENFDFKTVTKETKIRNGNIKARLRMIYLYNLASANNGLVLSTDNYTEYMLGFWTLHGDVGDYGMIQELWKTEVYNMAEYLSINEYYYNKDAYDALHLTINSLATDGLGVTESGDLGQIFPEWDGTSRDGYAEVDRKLQAWKLLFDEAAKTPKVIEAMSKMAENPVIKRHLNSAFKRNNPYTLKREKIL